MKEMQQELSFNGSWEKKRKRLLSNFSKLENDQLELIDGRENEIVMHVKKRLDITFWQAIELICLS